MEQFRGVLLEAIGDARPLEVAEPDIAPKEERQFSFIRAIRASATGDWREAGYEREVSDEIARQSGRTPKGFFAPASAWGQRNLIVGTDADGGFLKPTDHYGKSSLQPCAVVWLLPGWVQEYSPDFGVISQSRNSLPELLRRSLVKVRQLRRSTRPLPLSRWHQRRWVPSRTSPAS